MTQPDPTNPTPADNPDTAEAARRAFVEDIERMKSNADRYMQIRAACVDTMNKTPPENLADLLFALATLFGTSAFGPEDRQLIRAVNDLARKVGHADWMAMFQSLGLHRPLTMQEEPSAGYRIRRVFQSGATADLGPYARDEALALSMRAPLQEVEILDRVEVLDPQGNVIAVSKPSVRSLYDQGLVIWNFTRGPLASLGVEWLEERARWSRETFGPGARTKGVLAHIRKELAEIEADPTDATEWADLIILALDGASRAGIGPETMIEAILEKHERNKSRTWPDWRGRSEDDPIEHVRTSDGIG